MYGSDNNSEGEQNDGGHEKNNVGDECSHKDGNGNNEDDDGDNVVDIFGNNEDDDANDFEGVDDEDGDRGVDAFSSSVNDKVILSNFQDWLKGPDGGRKDEKCSKQCARQVQMAMQYINPEKQTITDLLSKTTLRDKWLKPVEKMKQPGTVKSYLGSLNQFFIFLHAECSDQFEELETTASQLVRLSEQVKLWARSCRKMMQDRFWEKRIEDIAKLKKPQDIKEFDTSKVARNAVKILGEFQDNPNALLTQSEYTNVRDYLMTMLCIDNGSRSGPIANMTLDEFNNCTKQQDRFVVRVKKHKTFTTHGPVNLVLTSTLHEYLSIFITIFRNQIPAVEKTQQSTVLVSWRGVPLDSSQVGAQIGSCWGKVFGKRASTGGATSFRKAAVSAVHESNKELRGDLADLMVHNKTTADRYYLLQDKGKSAVRTSKKLWHIMRNDSAGESGENLKDGCADNQDVTDEPSTGSNIFMPHRHKWSSEEESAIQSLFSHSIEAKEISINEVRTIAKDHPLLGKLATSKIRDKIKIRTYFKDDADMDADSPKLPEEEESAEQKLKRFGVPTIHGKFIHTYTVTPQDPFLLNAARAQNGISCDSEHCIVTVDFRSLFKARFPSLF